MPTSPRRFARPAGTLLAAVLAVTGLAACSDDDNGGGALVVYSGRNENLVRPILDRFEKESGIDISVRYGDSAELAATILEEGDGSRADVFFSQDAGALAALARQKVLGPLPAPLIDPVDERFRDPGRRWVGVSGRVRVIAYNTSTVQAADVPDSVFDLTAPAWKDRVGIAPPNASFIAFVSAVTEQRGRPATKEWLEALKANGAKTFDNNIAVLEAIADGEVDVGLVNHYYLYNEFEQRPGSPVANHYPGQQDGGEGTFVNAAGVGVLAGTKRAEQANEFVAFLLGAGAQEYFRDETAEYPMRAGVDPLNELPPLDTLKTIDVPLSTLGRDLEASLELLKEVGLT